MQSQEQSKVLVADLLFGGRAAAVMLLQLAILILLPLAPAPVEAGMRSAQAETFVGGLGREAFALLQQRDLPLPQRRDAFDRILRKGFDLDFIGRFALGKYWRLATPDQRAAYLDVFKRFLIGTYSHQLRGFAGRSFVITGSSSAGQRGDILVETRIDRTSGPSLVAGWRVRATGGEPKIIDVVVEGVSMAITQRHEFASVTRRHGVEGLLKALSAKADELAAMGS